MAAPTAALSVGSATHASITAISTDRVLTTAEREKKRLHISILIRCLLLVAVLVFFVVVERGRL